MKPHWDRFEWDDENRKNGNVQHLRDHDIEPEEAEECFFHEFEYGRDERFDDVYLLDGTTDRGRRLRLVFQDKGNDWFESSRAGSLTQRRSGKDEKTIL